MKILLVNKFLYSNGGSETYIFKLSEQLKKMGHEVTFFGMRDERNIVGNDYNAYTENMDFRDAGGLKKLKYPIDIIYSAKAKNEIKKVLDAFKPDVVHLNNINFQITPSIIYEIKNRNIPIVWTIHDYQLVCPNHMLYIPQENRICEECLTGGTGRCIKNKCLHNSTAKSVMAALEGDLYKRLAAYSMVDTFICPSEFINKKVSTSKRIKGKTITMYNFIDGVLESATEKKNYALYFGRFDKEKGIKTLVSACKALPDINFVFAGKGELETEFDGVGNIKNVGFQSGEAIKTLIKEARFSIYPSEWYENCPFSVMESQMYRTPVLGADIGGIPELIKAGETGLLFESGNEKDLAEKIRYLWDNPEVTDRMSENCSSIEFDDTASYCEKLLEIYRGQSV